MPASGRAESSACLADDAAEKARSAMATYKYRQPLVGQAFVDLVEGQHSRGLALDAYAGRYLLICCFGSNQIDPGRVALEALREHTGLFEGRDQKLSRLHHRSQRETRSGAEGN